MDGSGSASSCASMMTRYALSTLQAQGRIASAAKSATCSADLMEASFFPTNVMGYLPCTAAYLTNAWQESSMVRVSLCLLEWGEVLRLFLSCCTVFHCDAL